MYNIIYISMDCVRWDRLGCYGFKHAETGTIDKLAETGTIYTNCYCQAPYTPASHASFLTGLNPYQHGIRTMYGSSLRDDVETIPEKLSREGYNTAAFVGYEGLLSMYGLGRGFKYWDENSNLDVSFGQSQIGFKGNDWRDNFKTWHDKNQKTSPHFVFFHYFHAHTGSEAVLPDKYKSIGERLVIGTKLEDHEYQWYDGKIAWFDHEWLPVILERYSLDDSIIVLTSDHGDGIDMSSEVGHRRHLFEGTTHIPLIINHPDWSQLFRGRQCFLTHSTDIFFQYPVPREYIYHETNHRDIPGYRIGLFDGKKRVVFKSSDLKRDNIVWDEAYDRDDELEDALLNISGIFDDPNMKFYDRKEEHMRRLIDLGYL